MRRMIAVVCVVAVGLALVGCGGGGVGDYSSPKATAQTMFRAMKAGDWNLTMSCFDKNAREAFGEIIKLVDEMKAKLPADKQGMLGGMDMRKKMMEEAKDAPEPKFGEEKIDGDKATLVATTVENGKEKTETINFVNEGGQWKMMPMSEDELKQMKQGLPMMKAMLEGMMKAGAAK